MEMHCCLIGYYYTHTTTSQRETEILKQDEKEGFTTYLTRRKRTAAPLVTAPPEAEMVKTFISNLQPKYKNHLRYLRLETLSLIHI